MGSKTKMMSCVACLFLATTTQQSGCNGKQAPPPPPTIEVERVDTTDWAGVTVRYRSHCIDQGGRVWVTLGTPEEVEAYKKQVEFLLSRLDETRTRMNVHEPAQPVAP